MTDDEMVQKINQAVSTAETFSLLYYKKLDQERHTIDKMYHENANIAWNGRGHKYPKVPSGKIPQIQHLCPKFGRPARALHWLKPGPELCEDLKRFCFHGNQDSWRPSARGWRLPMFRDEFRCENFGVECAELQDFSSCNCQGCLLPLFGGWKT